MREPAPILKENIENIGGKLKIIPAGLLPRVENAWLECMAQLGKTSMYRRMLHDYFDFSLDPNIKSLVIIALPSPPLYVDIAWESQTLKAVVPPAYLYRDRQLSVIKSIVSRVFEEYGLHSYPVVLPKKMLAAISGFGQYGRNNILYIPGLGSCHRLTVFASDMAADKTAMQENIVMNRCAACGICARKCPTGAIGRNGGIINADRCLTYHNEMGDSLPEWLQSGWHNSLVGCTRCQEFCPENRGLWNSKKAASFSVEDTQAVMENAAFDTLNAGLRTQLKDLCLDRYYGVLSRNIRLLLHADQNKPEHQHDTPVIHSI